jgi:hypothetical protein
LMRKFYDVFSCTNGRIVVCYPDISTWITGFAFHCVLQGISSDSVSTVDQRQWRSNT